MAALIQLPSNSDPRGSLTVVENELPFSIKRVFYIHQIPDNTVRGGHGHIRNHLGMVSVHGACQIRVRNAAGEKIFKLENPQQLLYLKPEDWHEMSSFQNECVLLVMASEKYDKEDYFYEAP